jgi:hypothetical protein
MTTDLGDCGGGRRWSHCARTRRRTGLWPRGATAETTTTRTRTRPKTTPTPRKQLRLVPVRPHPGCRGRLLLDGTCQDPLPPASDRCRTGAGSSPHPSPPRAPHHRSLKGLKGLKGATQGEPLTLTFTAGSNEGMLANLLTDTPAQHWQSSTGNRKSVAPWPHPSRRACLERTSTLGRRPMMMVHDHDRISSRPGCLLLGAPVQRPLLASPRACSTLGSPPTGSGTVSRYGRRQLVHRRFKQP